MLEINTPFSDDIVRLEEISVVSLELERIVILLSWIGDVEQHSVIETCLSV